MGKKEKIFNWGKLLAATVMALMVFVQTTVTVEAQVWDGTIAEEYDGGTGIEDDPYIIATTAQLAYFAQCVNGGNSYEDVYFELTENLNLSGINWMPIGNTDTPFRGKFDGNNHVISNLVIENSRNIQGLFGYNYGEIKNIGIESGHLNCPYGVWEWGMTNPVDGYYVGAVCGTNQGTIENCYNKAEVAGVSFVGGICGLNAGTVRNCYNKGNIRSLHDEYSKEIGGVCGCNSGKMQYCYNMADVTGLTKVGGLCGCFLGSIHDSYSVGKVSGKSDVGGAWGYNVNAIVSNCYYNKDLMPAGTVGGTGLTTYEMTGANALSDTMGFDTEKWNKKATDKTKKRAYYPDLACFERDSTFVSYDSKVVLTEQKAENPSSDGLSFCVDAKIKFEGMNDYVSIIDNCKTSDFNILLGTQVVCNTVEISEGIATAKISDNIPAGEQTFMLRFVGEDAEFFEDETDTCTVTIGKKVPKASDFVFTEPANCTFDGNKKTAMIDVASNITGMGEITVVYDAEPVNAGTYNVSINVAEGSNYAAVTGLTDAEWNFEIKKAVAPEISDVEQFHNWNVTDSQMLQMAGLPENLGVIKNAELNITDEADIIGDEAEFADGKLYYTLNANTAEKIGKSAIVTVNFETQNYEPFSVDVLISLKDKEMQNAPAECDLVFAIDENNNYTATITSVEGAEYKFNDGPWSSENVLNNISHGTSVTAYIRMAETDVYNASTSVSANKTTGHGALTKKNAITSDCENDGVIAHWACESCNKYFADEKGVTEITNIVDAKTGHNWATAVWSSDKEGHWHECKNENCPITDNTAKEGYAKHSGGTATCCKKAVCDVCGAEYGEVNYENHAWDNGVITKKPTAKKTGIKTFTCKMCGMTKTETLNKLAAPAVGTTLSDDGNKGIYKITKAGVSDGTVAYVRPVNRKAATVTIPEKVVIGDVSYKVTSIEKEAFKGNKYIKKVTIGSNVVKIGEKAFYKCSKLKTIKIKTTKLKSSKVGKNAFKGIYSKATIFVPKKKMSTYKTMLKKKGVTSKAKFKNL